MATTSEIFALQAHAARSDASQQDPNLPGRILFDTAWKRTRSLSEAAAQGLSDGIRPALLVSEMRKGYVLQTLPTISEAIQKNFQAPEIGQADAVADLPQEEDEALGRIRVSLALWRASISNSSTRLAFMANHEKTLLEEMSHPQASDPADRLATELSLLQFRSLSRVLVEQQAFTKALRAKPVSQNPGLEEQTSLINQMIIAGRAAVVEFDARFAANPNIPLKELCAEAIALETKGPPTQAQKQHVAAKMAPSETKTSRLLS